MPADCLFTFEGDVIIVKTLEDLDRACAELSTHEFVSFDAEWLANPRGDVSLLQIGVKGKVFLFPLALFATLAPERMLDASAPRRRAT